MTDMADILSSKILKCQSSFHLNSSVSFPDSGEGIFREELHSLKEQTVIKSSYA